MNPNEEALWRFLRKRPGDDPEKAEDETSDDGGNDDDGSPDQPEKYLHCRYSGYIAEVEAPEPRDEQDDEGYTFC